MHGAGQAAEPGSMTDFYSILRSAIDESGATTADARATIYLRAWAALEAQFDAPDVALPADARKAQRVLMDEAIGRIEAEFGAAPPAAEATPALADEAEAEVETEAVAEAAPEPAVPEPVVPPPPDVTPPPDVMPADVTPAGTEPRSAAPLSRPAPPPRSAPPPGVAPRPRGVGRPPPQRSSTRAALILFLVVLAGAGGVGYWLWDDLRALVAGEGERAGALTATEPPPPAPVAPGAAPPPAAPAPERPAPAAPAQTADAGEPPAGEPPAPAPGGKTDRAPSPAGQAETGFVKDEERVGAETRAAVERGFLVLEPDEPGQDDLRLAGTSRWSIEGAAEATSLNIDVQIPERGESLRLTLRANRDEALPASHTIDLVHQGRSGEASLAEVIGIMAIEDRIETAQPLRAAGALVVPGQYLLALRGAPADRRENMARLRAAQWLAVRSVLSNGKHAVFVIEIGASGAQIMAEAMAAWGEVEAGGAGE